MMKLTAPPASTSASKGSMQVNVASAGFNLVIDRLAIERRGGVHIPLPE